MAEFGSDPEAYNSLLGKFQERVILTGFTPKKLNVSVSVCNMDALHNASTVSFRNFRGRIAQTAYPDRSRSSTIYACCGPKDTPGRNDMAMTYPYSAQRNHWPTAAAVTQGNTYHATGSIFTQMVVV